MPSRDQATHDNVDELQATFDRILSQENMAGSRPSEPPTESDWGRPPQEGSLAELREMYQALRTRADSRIDRPVAEQATIQYVDEDTPIHYSRPTYTVGSTDIRDISEPVPTPSRTPQGYTSMSATLQGLRDPLLPDGFWGEPKPKGELIFEDQC